MGKRQFSVTKIGSKIYRYIDINGKKGCFHLSKNDLTPVEQLQAGDKVYVFLDGHYYRVNNIQELDAIDNALNNYKKSLIKVLQTPSKVIAQTNPELYQKVLFAVRTAIYYEAQSTPMKKGGNSVYEELDLIVKKLDKINKELAKLRETETIQEKI